jgi:hypothetical protein
MWTAGNGLLKRPLHKFFVTDVKESLFITTYIDYNTHEIPIATQSRQGHCSSFIKRYARRSYLAPC